MSARTAHWAVSRLAGCALLFSFLLTGFLPTNYALAAPTPGSAVQDFGACLQQHKRGAILLTIDTSGSLKSTDPSRARVVGAQVLLAGLARSAQAGRFTLDVGISGFDFTLSKPDWMALTPARLAALQSSVAAIGARDDGFETDYWSALTMARSALDQRAPVDEAGGCRALIVFTDGKYELTARTSAEDLRKYQATKPISGVEQVHITTDAAANQVVTAGKHDICRPGGVADQSRVDGITTFAVGLSSTGPNGTTDFGFLKGIATNADGGCGKQPGRGVFVSAENIQDLVLAFDAFADPRNQPGPVVPKGICPRVACSSDQHVFALDSSIRRIHLLGAANVDGILTQLRVPNQAAVTLRYSVGPRVVMAGSTSLTVTWFSRSVVSIDADYGQAENWNGTWSLLFIDPTGDNPNGVSKTQLTISGDLEGEVAPVGQVTSSATARFQLRTVRTDGTPVQLGSPLPTVTAEVIATSTADPTKPVTVVTNLPVKSSSVNFSWAVPPSFPAGAATLTTVLRVRTATGLQLAPQSRRTPLTVAAPPNAPVVHTKSVDFGLIQGTASGKGAVRISGAGCAWLSAADFTVFPERAKNDTVTSDHTGPSKCLSVPDGGEVDLELLLRNPASANGKVQGKLTLQLAPKGFPDRASPVVLPFTASVEGEAKASVEIAVFVLAMLVGLGVPLGGYAYLKWRAGAFPGGAVDWLTTPVEVTGSVASLTDPSTVHEQHLQRSAPISQGAREAILGPLVARARFRWRPDQPGRAVLDAPGRVGVGSEPEHVESKSGLPLLPLALQNSWAFLLLGPGDAEVLRGELLLVVAQGASAAQLSDLAQRAVSELPNRLAEARGQWPDVVRADPPTAGVGTAASATTGDPPGGSNPSDWTGSSNPPSW